MFLNPTGKTSFGNNLQENHKGWGGVGVRSWALESDVPDIKSPLCQSHSVSTLRTRGLSESLFPDQSNRDKTNS